MLQPTAPIHDFSITDVNFKNENSKQSSHTFLQCRDACSYCLRTGYKTCLIALLWNFPLKVNVTRTYRQQLLYSHPSNVSIYKYI